MLSSHLTVRLLRLLYLVTSTIFSTSPGNALLRSRLDCNTSLVPRRSASG